MNTPMKRCTKCGQEFPDTMEYFYVQKTCKNGLRPDCIGCVTQQHRHHYQANRVQMAALKRQWCKDHPERVRAAQRRADRKRPNRKRRLSREQERVNKEHRRALKRKAGGTHTVADIRDQYKRQKGRCYWCHAKVGDTYHIDHVIPLSRGGSNGPDNLVISCPFCNISKGNKLPHEWDGNGGKLL